MTAVAFNYDVTGTEPTGFRVCATHPVHGTHLIGNFGSLQAAETFADDMREIDAGPSHGTADYRLELLVRRNHNLLAAGSKARSEIRETRLMSARIGAKGKAQQARWEWFRDPQRRQSSSA